MIMLVTTHLFSPSPKLKTKKQLENLSSYLDNYRRFSELNISLLKKTN